MIPIRIIRRRIRSIKSTAKITKAMEMIAASKMRQAQLRVLAARPYSEKMREVLANLAAQPRTDGDSHPLLQHREVKRITVIHVSTDRGLCGGLNANMNRRTASFILEQSLPVNLVTVGRKGRDFMSRYSRDIRAEFTQLGDKPSLVDTTPIARVVIDDYTNKLTDEIYLAYTQFITTDRGLCGGLNANMNRRTASFILEQSIPVNLITVGRKGRDFMSRYGRDIRAEFTQLGDKPSLVDTTPIARVVIDDYTNKLTDEIYLAYTQFITTVIQRPVLWKLLPIEPAKLERSENIDYIYEPSPSAVLRELLPRYLEMQVYHAILESIASEQSVRMVAMRNATDNANEMIEDLTLIYNKARQELITKELLDIAGGIVTLT